MPVARTGLGAMAIAGHATSMLAPAQNAAEQAANERTTGNYAYGNVSMANSTAIALCTDGMAEMPPPTTSSGPSRFRSR